jgi:hypothetical protein
MTVAAVAIFAVLLVVVGSVAFFRWHDSESEKAARRRVENEQLKHAAMLREEERQSAYAAKVVVRSPGSPIGVTVKARKAKKPMVPR